MWDWMLIGGFIKMKDDVLSRGVTSLHARQLLKTELWKNVHGCLLSDPIFSLLGMATLIAAYRTFIQNKKSVNEVSVTLADNDKN